MKIVLDTHVLVFAANGTLAENRKQLLRKADSEILFSTISLWEIAKLIQIGRLHPVGPIEQYLARFSSHPRYQEVALTAPILARMVDIAPKMHKDPADQLVIATALIEGAVLMTDDILIRKTKLVKVI